MTTKLRIIGMIFTAAVLFGAGWQFRSWYEDSKDLAELKATEKAIRAFEEKESAIAHSVEMKLEGLRANERVIERWRTKVVDRPIYNVQCIDDDGLSLIKSYAENKPAKPND